MIKYVEVLGWVIKLKFNLITVSVLILVTPTLAG